LIRAEDVHTSIMPLDRPGVHLASAEELVGKAAIRDLAPYSVVDAKAVQNPSSAKTEIVVKANSAIDLIYSNNGVEIRMSGLRALNSGAVGDSIMVLNTRTNKRVRGQIIDGQTAKVIVAGAVD
jgi:flagella basal body P-ring formation protein FlgA